MRACEDCLLHSVLRAEAVSLYERDSFSRAEAAAVLRLPPEEMRTALSLRHPDLERAMDRRTREIVTETEPEQGFWTICSHEPEYPERLLSLVDPPPVLYGTGGLERFAGLVADGIAVVGSRRASAYGREVAYSLGNAASSIGLTVVSGMALGIDGAAHRGALQGGGRTIAVLAGSPERAYPRSHRLLHEQIGEVGCVVSESPPGTEARRWAFVARNRIIAGLARMTIIVEGSTTSGALYTVRFADQVDSAIGAVPGPVTAPGSAGPNELLRAEGVVLVRGIDDVISELKLDQLSDLNHGRGDFSVVEEQILSCISSGERTPRALAAALPELEHREISRALGRLELIGVIELLAGGEYARVG